MHTPDVAYPSQAPQEAKTQESLSGFEASTTSEFREEMSRILSRDEAGQELFDIESSQRKFQQLHIALTKVIFHLQINLYLYTITK